MSILKFLQRKFFDMSARDFLNEWKKVEKEDQEELRTLGRVEALEQGIEINN